MSTKSQRRTSASHPLDEPIKILCFTWNVGNAMPFEEELSEWLKEEEQPFPWDLVVVGTQENAFKSKKHKPGELAVTEAIEETGEDAPKATMPEGSSQKAREKDAQMWDAMVARRLGKAYYVVKHVVLWEMRLTVYAKLTRRSSINNVQKAISATGVGGVLGNKGGLIVRLNVGQTSLAFISCHLAAHAPKLAQRNQNCQEVLRETEKNMGTRRLDAVSQFDHVFWMGDLNYRIDLNTTKGGGEPYPSDDKEHHAAVKTLIDAKDWSALYKADQLMQSRDRGEAFHGFTETPPSWAPTFKVKRSVNDETPTYKDQRIPSYCDRVLWKSMPPLAGKLVQTKYTSLPRVSTSDHKPVVATFELTPSELGRAAVEQQSSFSLFATLKSPRSFKEGRDAASSIDASRAPARTLRSLHGRKRDIPLVRINQLQLASLMDMDMGGGSDPYCIFYSNPPNLLADKPGDTPITTVKQAKRAAKRAATQQKLDLSQVDLSDMSPGGPVAGASSPGPEPLDMWARGVSWQHAEIPLLRPRLADPANLPACTLIIAVYDKDVVSTDDLLGVALVPLTPTPSDGPPPGSSERQLHEFTIDVEAPLAHGNATKGVGFIKANLTVSYGDALNDALQKAVSEHAGVRAQYLSSRKGVCSVM
jgi:endonuclease/exonuclease/phosphatase family metal-dependent hydrolase